MARRREHMSEGKKNMIASLLQEYDIKSAEDIQDSLKDLLGGAIHSTDFCILTPVYCSLPRMQIY